MRRRNALAIAAVLCLAGVTSATAQGNPNPGVLPPNSSPHGNTYAEWSVLWWRWFISLAVPDNPVSGAPCSNGQVGSVWFLAGVPGTNSFNCTIPNGKTLFFPIINTECSNREDPPFFGNTEPE